MPRLGSRKSRTGCIQCKARHVKCDESRPCRNCNKYGADCSLVQLPGGQHPNANNACSPESVASLTSPSSSPASSQCSSQAAAPLTYVLSSRNWQDDLHLMYHYTAYAHRTIPADAAAEAVWAHKVPEQAFQFPFLMHALLAFSAHHLAHLHPASHRQYSILASEHQVEASRGMRSVLPALDRNNRHALFASASLLALIAFATSATGVVPLPDTPTRGQQNSLAALFDISVMLRGMNAVIEDTQELIHSGPMAPVFASSPCAEVPPQIAALRAELKGEDFMHLAAASRVASAAAWDLRESLEFCIKHSPHPALRLVFFWLIKVETEFWELLRSGQDWACWEIMRRYVRILEQAGQKWWFLDKWKNVEWV